MKSWRFFILVVLCAFAGASEAATNRPNIIFIMADDLGYGEIGSYGQKKIKTPHLDLLAARGMRFTQFYAGSTVCAPSRSVLMTGLHTGHTRVRGNAGANNPRAQMLRSNDVTIAKALKQAGYNTALIGKWGLGMNDEGHPNLQGFDYFFGYLSQHHAHNNFPNYLWRNQDKVNLPNDLVAMGPDGAGYSKEPTVFSGDLFADEAVRFLREQRDKPFFLYLALVVPHANNERNRALKNGSEVPDLGPYAKEKWTDPQKGHAAAITRMDDDIGRMMLELERLHLDTNTLIIFTSDNGPHKEAGFSPDFFDANGPFRGIKRDLTDGGIRVPFIACWPGMIPAGKVSSHVGYFGDFFPTAAELAGAEIPGSLDGISLVPTLLGKGKQASHPWLYWEFHESGFSQAVLIDGRWKGIRRQRPDRAIELYDLKNDPEETRDLADTRRNITRRVENLFEEAREDSPDWPIKPGKALTRD